MPRAVAISPHLDDAVFSCGATLAALVRSGWDVAICTVFTLSMPDPTGFALACQLDKNLPPDVDYMALRRQEDRAACRILGCAPIWLPIAEAPHRGYPDAASLFAQIRADDDVAAAVADALGHVLDSGVDLLLAPQAIGGHVDHVQTVLALQHVRPKHVPVLWWTDFPYSIRPHTHPARPFSAIMDRWPDVAFPGISDARLPACSAYATQIGFQFGGPDGLAEALRQSDGPDHLRLEGALPKQLAGMVATAS